MFKIIHSSVSYLVLILVLFTFINAIVKLRSKESYKINDYYIAFATAMLVKLQLVLGIASYYFSAYYQTLREVGFKAVMKDSGLRLFIMEHPLMMLLGISLIVIGFYKHKNETNDTAKFKKLAWFFGVALIIILSRIPWVQWFNS